MKIRIYTDIMCVFPFTQLSTFLSSSNLCHQTWKSSGQLLSASPGHPAIFVQEMKAPGSLLQLPCWPNLAVPQAHKLIPSKMLSGTPYLILSSASADLTSHHLLEEHIGKTSKICQIIVHVFCFFCLFGCLVGLVCF